MSESALAAPPRVIVISQYEVLLADIKEAVDSRVSSFEYETTEGNKAARSYVFSLRKIKARIDVARKEAGAEALRYSKAVNTQAAELTKRVQDLIDPHVAALDAITKREAQRVFAHQEVLAQLRDLQRIPFGATSAQIQQQLDALGEIDVTDLEEFREQAAALKLEGLEALRTALATAQASEAQAQELARLQAEEAQRKQAEASKAQAQAEAEEAERRQAEKQEWVDNNDWMNSAETPAEGAAQPAVAETQGQVGTPSSAQPLASSRRPSASPAPPTSSFRPLYQGPPPPPPAPLVMSPLQAELASQLEARIMGLTRQQLAVLIATDRLHPAVRVQPENV